MCGFYDAQTGNVRYDFIAMNQEIPATARAILLREWYQRPLGYALAEAEQNALASQLPNIFGYHLVIIDPPWKGCRLDDSRITHRMILRVAATMPSDANVLADTDHWPIMSDSVDAIILPHTLELATNPHQVLREADRSLIPDGHLIILGFNPFSLWGVRQLLNRRNDRFPWSAHFRSQQRIRDWLGLLGFETLQSHYLFQRPPLQSEHILRKLQFMERVDGAGLMLLSACYILLARKRSSVLTPLRDAQRLRNRVFPVGIPSSTQGNVRRVR
jgi:SAM-dependent methyltransferase